jgi:hypothetical protein
MTIPGRNLLATMTALLALSCSATPEPETPEELLFEVPSWCSWGYTPPSPFRPESPRGHNPAQPRPPRGPSRYNPARPRSDWTGWVQARQASTEGRGLCGVRLALGGPELLDSEPGICLEVQGGEVKRLAVLDEDGQARPAALQPPRPGSAWRELRLSGSDQRLHVRVDGRTVHAYLEGSGSEARGPCFYREP